MRRSGVWSFRPQYETLMKASKIIMKTTKSLLGGLTISLGLTGRNFTSSILPLVLLLAMPAKVQAKWLCATNQTTIPNTLTITGYTGPGGAVNIPTALYNM